MTKCPFCDAELVEERREIEKGVWATVEVCPNCKDEWIDEVGHDWLVGLFKRKTFNLGGSVAVRIPKEIADALSIGAGTSVNFTVRDGKMIISKIWSARVGVSGSERDRAGGRNRESQR